LGRGIGRGIGEEVNEREGKGGRALERRKRGNKKCSWGRGGKRERRGWRRGMREGDEIGMGGNGEGEMRKV
jgi:hypothetical protein